MNHQRTVNPVSYISFEHVKKEYRMGEVIINAVDGVDFVVEKGEFAIIVGPSGAGKTTVLNMLGGMDACSGGVITVDGARVSDYSPRQLTAYRRHDIGFVFQFYNLVQNLTALENVELAAQICRDPLSARDVLDHVGLGHRVDNFPAQLSGGEQQRVAIARALLNNPSTIIADEPTGNLDPARSLEIMRLLERINALGTTVLVVTHEKDLVNRFDKRVVMLERGRVVSDGKGWYGRR